MFPASSKFGFTLGFAFGASAATLGNYGQEAPPNPRL
jgi:hypothetical protein